MLIRLKSYLSPILQNKQFRLAITILTMSAWIYTSFIFGDNYFLWTDIGSDTVNSYWPAYTYFSNALRQGGEFFSLELGLGMNIFSGSLLFFDPFFWLYALVADAPGIAKMILFVYLLKILIGSLCFQAFLGYYLKSDLAIFIFSLMYAFNGFTVVWGQHFFFGTLVMVFPMVLLGIEWFIHLKKSWLLSLSIALAFASSYYFMYMAFFFLIIFIPARLYYLYGSDIRRITKQLIQIGAVCALGVGISAVVLLPTIDATLTTSRVSGQFAGFPFYKIADTKTLITILGSLFPNSLLGPAPAFLGVVNFYDSAHLYTSVLTLLVLPYALAARAPRERGFQMSLLSFTAMVLLFQYAAIIFNGFSTISYRWTYFVIVFLLLTGALAFQNLRSSDRGSGPIVRLSLHLWLLLSMGVNLYFLYKHLVPVLVASSNLTADIQTLVSDRMIRILPVIILLLAYFLVLVPFARFKFSNTLLVLLVITELVLNTRTTLTGRTPLSLDYITNKQGYFDGSMDAIQHIKHADSGLYRIDKTFFSVFWNDGLLQNFRNFHGYWSIIPEKTLNFFNQIGGTTPMNAQLGGVTSEVIRSLLSVKYKVDRNPQEITQAGYELVGQWDDVYLYENNYWVPMGSMYTSFISESEFYTIPVGTRDLMMAKACVIPDELVEKARQMGLSMATPITDLPENTPDSAAYKDLQELASTSIQIATGEDDFIEGTITAQRAGIVFFPIVNDSGWQVMVNQRKADAFDTNLGMIGFFVEPGRQEVTLRYIPPLFIEGAVISGISFTLMVIVIFYQRRVVHKRTAG